MFDHILRNGRLTDRANGLEDACLDVAVQDGMIAKIAVFRMEEREIVFQDARGDLLKPKHRLQLFICQYLNK